MSAPLLSKPVLWLVALFAILMLQASLGPAASAASGPSLGGVTTGNCTPTSGTASFKWQPAPGTVTQWVDVSVHDNAFSPGTFVGNGPFGANDGSLTWAGFEAGATYFWRVNAATPAGWLTSETGSFVVCGGANLLQSSVVCEADGTATVQFRWAPSSFPTEVQWLDLTLESNGFAPGTFLAAGPMPSGQSSLTWRGIAADRQHFYRVNSLSSSGWQSTATGSITPCPSASREPAPPPSLASLTMQGERWILVDLERQEATAMIGDRPVYTALVTTGKEDWETPRGTFQILYRVANETMTSASIGAEEYYVLEDVLYTQYFTNEGHALHLNYWRPDSYFGEIPSSHGCVGMRLEAAEFFWNFATNGTRVTII